MAMYMWLLCSLLFSSAFAVKTGRDEDFYYAAVVEYSPHEGTDGNDTVLKNGREFVRIIEKAAETVDIVVFPELALNYEDDTVYVEVPFGNNSVVPADNPHLHPVIQMLSKAARDNEIYVSFTVLEKDTSGDKVLTYNTNVVIDRKGLIVSRYRKFNLYQEYFLNIPKVPDISIFETDFGVRFGVFICADIFFKNPGMTLVYEKKITDFIYPNWFFAELRLGLSVQVQFGWAYMTDSTFLSAGINSIQQGSTGSGIFQGRKGSVVNILSEKNETRILTAKLYKKGKTGQSEGKILEPLTEGVDSTHEMEPVDYQYYKTHLLTPELKNSLLSRTVSKDNSSIYDFVLNKTYNKTICQESLCCEFSISATFTYRPLEYLHMSDISYVKNDSYYHYQYRLATFNGIKGFPDAISTGIQVCAVIPCLNDSLSSCEQKTGNTPPLNIYSQVYGNIFLHSTSFDKISITAVTKEKTDYTFPNVLESSKSKSPKAFASAPDVSKMEFSSNGFLTKLKFSSDKLIYAGTLSRIFSRDGGKVGVSSGSVTA